MLCVVGLVEHFGVNGRIETGTEPVLPLLGQISLLLGGNCSLQRRELFRMRFGSQVWPRTKGLIACPSIEELVAVYHVELVHRCAQLRICSLVLLL